MGRANGSDICVNFFARELKNALEERGLTLWAICSRTGIANELVRRLQHGVQPPGNFSVLNPDNLDKVIAAFQLNKDPLCVIRLRAAIVANSVMSALVQRVRLEYAYVAAEEIFKYVVQGMQNGDSSFSNIRKVGSPIPEEESSIPTSETSSDIALESILLIIDRATNALHMSVGVPVDVELEYLWQARIAYETAQRALAAVSNDVKATDAWRYWYAAVQKDLAEVVENIDDASYF